MYNVQLRPFYPLFDRLPPLFEGDVVIDVWEQSLAPVGLNSMGNRQPCHQ